VNDEIRVVHQDPLGLLVAFEADGQFAALFQPLGDFVRNRLNLPRVRARADDKVIGERGDSAQIEDFDVLRFAGIGGANRGEPCRLVISYAWVWGILN
jgi:hypothetical protein